MNTKYKLRRDLSITFLGRTLYSIEALKDFGDVKKGDIGGYIEKESNLSINDNAWVYGDAEVSGHAWVSGSAEVFDNAWVYGDARVSGNARAALNMVTKNNSDLINIAGFKYSITINSGFIIIGCKQYKNYKDFLNNYIKDGTDNDYSEYDLKYLKVTVKNALTYLKNKGKGE